MRLTNNRCQVKGTLTSSNEGVVVNPIGFSPLPKTLVFARTALGTYLAVIWVQNVGTYDLHTTLLGGRVIHQIVLQTVFTVEAGCHFPLLCTVTVEYKKCSYFRKFRRYCIHFYLLGKFCHCLLQYISVKIV